MPASPASRPAEWSGGAAAAIALLVGRAFDLDAAAVSALTVLVGFTPAAVTWLVTTLRSPDPAK